MHFLTQSPLLKALGWALFNSLWQMALLWLSYSLLILFFRDMTARIRHALALTMLFIGTLWASITLVSTCFFPDNPAMAPWALLLSPAQTNPGWLWQICRGFMDKTLPYASSGYLLALCGLAVRFSSHYRQSRKLTRQGLSKLPSELRVFVASTSRRIGIQTPVRAWLSSLVDTPLTLGYLKPVILLPLAMINQLTPQQVEAVLIHEFAHILRKDYLFQLMVTAMEGLFFFNPFARLLIRQIKKEREHCCDDLVLQHQYNPHAYVSALLSLATRSQVEQSVALAATGGGDQLLLQRAKRILRQEKRSSGNRPGARPLALVLFAFLMTMIALYGPAHPAKQQGQRAMLIRHILFPTGTNARQAPAAAMAFSDHPALILMASTATATPHHLSVARSPRDARSPRVARHTPMPDADTFEPHDDDNGLFVNTAAVNEDNETKDPAREYSLISPGNADAAPPESIQSGSGAPFVPSSSFSFQFTTGDSSYALEKLTFLQQSGRKDIQAAIKQLQIQLSAQFKALASLKPKAEESVRLRRQLQVRELELQQQYLLKVIDWQKKWEKATHVKTIVYI